MELIGQGMMALEYEYTGVALLESSGKRRFPSYGRLVKLFVPSTGQCQQTDLGDIRWIQRDRVLSADFDVRIELHFISLSAVN